MHIAARSLGRVVVICAFAAGLGLLRGREAAHSESTTTCQAVVTPQTHQIKALARVKFTALDDINIASFELHNALRPTRVLDANGQPLSAERVSQDSTVRISLPNGLSKGSQQYPDLRIRRRRPVRR